RALRIKPRAFLLAWSDLAISAVVPGAVGPDEVGRSLRTGGRGRAGVGEELEDVGQAVGAELLLEALGHQRLLRRAQLLDVGPLEGVRLAFGVDQLDRRLGLRGEQAVEDAAVG